MVLPAICGEVFWSAAILAALGELPAPHLSDFLFSITEINWPGEALAHRYQLKTVGVT